MSKLITNTIRHTGGSADNITLDNSQNVTVEAKLTVANKDDDNVNVLEVKNDNGNVSGGFTQASDGDGQVFCKKNDGTNTVLFRSDGNSHITGGKVGIGTTGPDTLLHLSGADTAVIRLENTDSSLGQDQLVGGIEWESNDGSGAGAGVFGGIRLRSDDSYGARSYMAFSTRENSTGAAATDTEQLRILSQGGVTFNGDTAAANALDDYEYGTWTPSFNALSTGSMTTNYAKYVKIGHLVQVTFYVSCSSTSSNEFQMSMPFSNNNANGSWNVIPIQSNGSTVPLIGRIDENSTLMRVMTSWSSNSNGDSKQSYNDLNGEWIIGAGTYNTDS